MALRRGFKSEAERIARRVRTELALGAAKPVAPEILAELLGIEVRAGDELIPRERFDELEAIQPDSFSACTLRPSADRVVVVYNPLSSKSRRRSDIAHELAHVLLDHDLSRVERLGDVTFLSCDPTQGGRGCLAVRVPPFTSRIATGRNPKGGRREKHRQKVRR